MPGLSVEVILKPNSSISEREIIGICSSYLKDSNVTSPAVLSHFNRKECLVLYEDVEHIVIDNSQDENIIENYSSSNVNWYVYRLDRNGPQIESCETDDGSQVYLATHYVLPSAELFGMWESLIYDFDIKEKLLNYARTMMEFSERGVNPNIVTCNRVILLHGPPGTGKTSLCKALAQKLCVRMKDRYLQSILIEINTHSLFSKWFSESGKLVAKMFEKVTEVVELPNTLVCVLVDEVESLAHARDRCLSGNEPSDAFKVVNAVLTQLDQIKRFPNVIILTTSNMTEAIDVAFIDRADIKQYIGPPSVGAIHNIYKSCLEELIKADIICMQNHDRITNDHDEALRKVSEHSLGLSGRMLRKIPFLAHALFLNKKSVEMDEFLEAMKKTVDNERKQRLAFGSTKKEDAQ